MFPRTNDSLDADGVRGWMLSLLLVTALLVAWGAWFFLGRVEVYAVTSTARLEVDGAVQPIAAPVGGRLIAIRAVLGEQVRQDDVLFELDSDAEKLQLEEERARKSSSSAGIGALREQIATEARQKSPAKLAEQKRELARIEGQGAASGAAIARLEHEVERRKIRAPAAGRLAEVVSLGIGAVVRPGDPLASLVTQGDVKVVADFPLSALGRIHTGQSGRMRLDGFPWAQFGTLAVSVARVDSEPRSGSVRVELAVQPDPASPIPLQHGLPGTVEIGIERVAPATLVLRAAGQRVAAPTTSPTPADVRGPGR